MAHQLITSQDEFEEFCDAARKAGLIAFDTEFVSEDTFRPDLCLLQMAIVDRAVAVDPFEIKNLQPWWDLMLDDQTTVVVHGGQAEVRFCLHLGGSRPRKLVDVQVAQGLLSRSFPLGYERLVQRVLGNKLHGGHTRTDWRRRPLSEGQIEYALEDVDYILKIWKSQLADLQQLGRVEWAEAEFQKLIDDQVSDTSREAWQKLSGIHKLRPRQRAVARELCRWRLSEAESKNKPLRRVLRDDLIVELARRQPTTRHDVLATREMNRSGYKRNIDDIIAAIERGLAVPDSELDELTSSGKSDKNQDDHVLGQLLGLALANRCAEMNVAKPLVGTSADLRELVRWHLGGQKFEAPRLAVGWRATVCGELLEDLMDGKVALRVGDPDSDHPLVFESVPTPPES